MAVEIAPGLFRIESRLGSRRLAQWLLRGSEGALLLDTGIAGTVTETVAPALRELEVAPREVVEVILSHADIDHYGGNAEARELFPDARLRSHPLDRPLIESWETIATRRYGWYRGHGLDYPAETWEWLEDAAGPDVRLDGVVEAGERIDLGGLEVEILHLPGHSPGHLGLLIGGGEAAVIADAAMGRGFLGPADELLAPPPYGDLAAYRATIRRLRGISPRHLETAHFAPLAGADVGSFLDSSEELVDDLEAALERSLRDGPRPLPELLPECASAVGPYPEMEIELARSIGAHLEARSA